MILVGFAAQRTRAQENLEAGKTPSQIFAGTCSACHKGPRGLLKTVPAGSLSSFLRQHYTTSPNMAGLLANYLVSNGASDARLPKDGSRDAKPEAKQDARPAVLPEQPDRSGRKQRPATASREQKPEPAARPDEAELPAQAVENQGGDSGKPAKQRMSKRSKPGEEPPKAEGSPIGEAPREAAAKEEAKPEAAKPPGEAPAEESARAEPTGDTPVTQPDPVPQIAPATATSSPAPAASKAATPPPLSAAAVSAVVAGATTEAPAVPLPSTPAPAPAPAVTAAVPPLPPVAPAGPPAPPISQ
jgi:hypothetical protein